MQLFSKFNLYILTSVIICISLGTYFYTQSLQKNCTDGKSHACASLGEIYDKVLQNTTNSRKYYEQACDLGGRSSCVVLAESYHSHLSIKYYDKACDLGDGESCSFLAHYYSGQHRRRDAMRNKIQSYLRKGCNARHVYSCIRLKGLDPRDVFQPTYNVY